MTGTPDPDERETDHARSGAVGALAGGSLLLFFFSGAAALVYQVLWVRELRLLFGSTAESAAIAIAIFFTGIALGGWFWGARAARSHHPLRLFGLLEMGVAVTALGHFVVVDLYHRAYPTLYGALGELGAGDTLLKVLVATTLLLPSSFLMGGTLPTMGEHLVGRRPTAGRLTRMGTTAYAVNTAGSACGALAAGFVLPQALGYANAYLVAVGTDLGVGAIAVALTMTAAGRRTHPTPATAASEHRPTPATAPDAAMVPPRSRKGRLPVTLVWTIAAVSGLTTLAVEVIWTRLFAQVLQNSAHTYAIVLTTFLLALAVGAVAARRLAGVRRMDSVRILAGLLVLAGVATAVSPWLFHQVTGGVSYVGDDLGWRAYLVTVGGVAVVSMGLPAVALGAVLPYLLRMLEHVHQAPGAVIGRLVAVNTAGAILGSLAGAFLVLPMLGPWRGLVTLAALYPLLALAVVAADTRVPAPASTPRGRRRWTPRTATPALAAAVLVTLVSFGAVSVAAEGLGDAGVLRDGETLVASRHGPQANVAVVAKGGDLSIRVNTTYTLGGTSGLYTERDQALVPLLTHPDPQSVFFLGMGTGLTAGAALALPVEAVMVCELIRDVVSLSRAHLGDFTNGLFDDRRATVVSEDGRNCLARSRQRYDTIISDLFVPWEAGTGYLYTAEHYEMAASRLEPGGTYAQWIPLYQVSDQELGIIAATMDSVFEQVVVWRGDLFGRRSAIALVGHLDDTPLDPDVIVPRVRTIETTPEMTDRQIESMVLRTYVGNISASGVYADRDRNTDIRPLIEQLTPRTHRDVRAGRASFMVGAERERFYDDLIEALPPEHDPFLARLTDEQRADVVSGRVYSAYRYAHSRDAPDTADRLVEFQTMAPPGSTRYLSPARTLLPRELPAASASAPPPEPR